MLALIHRTARASSAPCAAGDGSAGRRGTCRESRVRVQPSEREHASHDRLRDDIVRTHDLVRPHVRRTPLLEIDLHDPDPACPSRAVVLKLEQLQASGSFKARGALPDLDTVLVLSAAVA